MAGKLVDHPLPIEFVLHRMMKNVQPDQSFQQILMLHVRHEKARPLICHDIEFRYRICEILSAAAAPLTLINPAERHSMENCKQFNHTRRLTQGDGS